MYDHTIRKKEIDEEDRHATVFKCETSLEVLQLGGRILRLNVELI